MSEQMEKCNLDHRTCGHCIVGGFGTDFCSDIARPACDKAGFFSKLLGNDTCVNAMGGDKDGAKR